MPDVDFIDSNVLIYAASESDAKFAAARAAIQSGVVVSVQVLNEFASVMMRKHRFSGTEVRSFLAGVRGLARIVPIDVATHDRALDLVERYRLQWWDALIISSALQAGCTRLISEDMHAGLVIADTLTLFNPFSAG